MAQAGYGGAIVSPFYFCMLPLMVLANATFSGAGENFGGHGTCKEKRSKSKKKDGR